MSELKNILLLGTSFSALPLANRIKDKNYNLITVGKNKYEPTHQISDMQIYEDYSDAENLIRAIKNVTIDAIVPSCNDYAYATATKLANEIKINFPDSIKNIELLHEKSSFKDLVKELNMEYAQPVLDVKDRKSSVIVKPVDSFSGKGCSVVMPDEDINPAIKEALKFSSSNKYVIEEFIDGTLHSLSSFIHEGKIIKSFSADEFCLHNAYAVSYSEAPSSLDNSIINKMIDINNQLVLSVGLEKGLLHTQFIVEDDRVFIIEVMRRAPGDLLGLQHTLSTGIDYWSLYLAGFISNYKQKQENQRFKKKFVSREIIATKDPAFFESLEFLKDDELRSSDLFVPLLTSGSHIEEHPNDKIGIFFRTFSSRSRSKNYLPSNNEKNYKL
jgi:formate-dependent phosphoribosylglycinamide formyltransferase (GAR transformylase)